jgi:hypothetical protein
MLPLVGQIWKNGKKAEKVRRLRRRPHDPFTSMPDNSGLPPACDCAGVLFACEVSEAAPTGVLDDRGMHWKTATRYSFRYTPWTSTG